MTKNKKKIQVESPSVYIVNGGKGFAHIVIYSEPICISLTTHISTLQDLQSAIGQYLELISQEAMKQSDNE